MSTTFDKAELHLKQVSVNFHINDEYCTNSRHIPYLPMRERDAAAHMLDKLHTHGMISHNGFAVKTMLPYSMSNYSYAATTIQTSREGYGNV